MSIDDDDPKEIPTVTVLVVDDVPELRVVWGKTATRVAESIRGVSVSVMQAVSAEQALTQVSELCMDCARTVRLVLITDVQMPNMDGDEMVKELARRHPHLFPATPVLFLSGGDSTALDELVAGLRVRISSTETGVDRNSMKISVMRKPTNSVHLRDWIRTAISSVSDRQLEESPDS